MSTIPFPSPGVTACQRCTRLCRTGTPDPKARAIVHGQQGLCPDCMLQRLLASIEPLNGTGLYNKLPEYLQNAAWREKTLRPLLAAVLGHTQLTEAEVNYENVARNWHLPWPANRHGKQLKLL